MRALKLMTTLLLLLLLLMLLLLLLLLLLHQAALQSRAWRAEPPPLSHPWTTGTKPCAKRYNLPLLEGEWGLPVVQGHVHQLLLRQKPDGACSV